MSQYLAYLYSTGLPKEEEIRIDKRVRRNREVVYLCVTRFPKNAKRKAKIFYIYLMFAVSVSVPLSSCAAVMLPPPTTMRRIQSSTLDSIGAQKRNSLRSALVVFSEKQIDELHEIMGKFINGSISIEEVIKELRGGNLEDWVAAFGIIIAIITVLNNVEAFQVPPAREAIPPPHLILLDGNQRPGNHFGYGKGAGPRSITVTSSQGNLYEGMTKEEIRNLPHPKDKIMKVKGRPKLTIHYGQAKFKLRDHGAIHGLPYRETVKAKTITLRTEENIDGFMDSIKNIVYDSDTVNKN